MTLSLSRFGEAADAYEASREGAASILGGGTLLIRDINMGDVSVDHLIRCDASEGFNISTHDNRITIGARVTMSQIASHPELDLLAAVARSIGGPAVRNMATVGGNLHAPAPYGDFSTALLTLDAIVQLQSDEGAFNLPIEAFLAERHRRFRGALIRAIHFQRPSSVLLYRKVTRVRPIGSAVLTIAALLNEVEGKIESARISYGAMHSAPIRARGVENALKGCSRTPSGISAAMARALDLVSPADDPIASAWYRREVLPVYLKRMLLGEGE